MRNQKSKKGFTLIELLIVIAIIGILAAILIPNLLRARRVATDRAAQGYVQNIYTASNAYMAEWVQATITDTITTAAGAVPGDCSAGWNIAGQYIVQTPSFSVNTCTVDDAVTDFVIDLDYNGGVAGVSPIQFP